MARQICKLYPLFLLAMLWEAAARLGLARPLFLPALSAVLGQVPFLLRDGDLWQPLLISLYRAAAGLLIALVAGLAIGFSVARLRWARLLFAPLVAYAAPAPKIAFLPVFILWFGIGDSSKILLVTFTTIFPFILAAQAAAETIPTSQIWAARAMGTRGLGLVRRIVLPASLPALMSGVRVAVPYAIITAFTAEMIAGGGGLGGSLVLAQRYFDTPTVFADLIVMAVVGYGVDLGLIALRRRWLRWHEG